MARLDTSTPIVIGVNEDKRARAEIKAQMACDDINGYIVPALQELGLKLPDDTKIVSKWLSNIEVFEGAVSKMLYDKECVSEVTNATLRTIMIERINEQVEQTTHRHRWRVTTISADDIIVVKGYAEVNKIGIKSRCTYILTTPEEIRAYHRLQKALTALNEFSGGKVENLHDYFTVLRNGEIVMRTMANFGIFNNE